MTSLKQKTISGLTWSFTENFARNSITFVIGIVLARLLLPSEFGLIGMITIFIAISTTLIDSGFNAALIRKNVRKSIIPLCFISIWSWAFLFYWILFFSAPAISRFSMNPSWFNWLRCWRQLWLLIL